MNIVVVGGTGFIGSKVVEKLRQRGMRQLPPRQTPSAATRRNFKVNCSSHST